MTMDSEPGAGWTAGRRTAYASLGAVAGGLIYAVSEIGDALVDSNSIRIALGTWLALASTLFVFAEQAGRRRADAAFAGTAGLVVALLFLSIDARFARSLPDGDSAVFIAAGAAISLIALSCYLCWSESGRVEFPYARLAHHAWRAPHVFVGAWIFVGAMWLVLFLWGQLFKLIEIEFFSDLFSEEWFAIPATGLAFGLAVAVLKDWDGVVAAARGLVLALLRILTPVVAGAVTLFVLFLPFTGLDPLWDRESPTGILLAAAAIAILLINSVIQDDDQAASDNVVLRISASALVVLLPVLVALAAAAAWLRVDQYGLTPDRAYGLILIVVAGLYALSYLWSLAVRRRAWQAGIRMLNIRLAAVAVLVAAAVCTPVLDVQKMAAANQVDRLLSTRVSVDAFDFYFLRYRLGIAGEAAAARLRAAGDHPDHGQIVTALNKAEEAGDCPGCGDFDHDATRALAALESPAVRVLTDGVEVPVSFRAFVAEHYAWSVTGCNQGEQPGCFLIIADLFGDTRPEPVLINRMSRSLTVYVDRGGRWDPSPVTHMFDMSDEDYDALLAALEAGELSVVTPSHRTVRAGGVELPITARH